MKLCSRAIWNSFKNNQAGVWIYRRGQPFVYPPQNITLPRGWPTQGQRHQFILWFKDMPAATNVYVDRVLFVPVNAGYYRSMDVDAPNATYGIMASERGLYRTYGSGDRFLSLRQAGDQVGQYLCLLFTTHLAQGRLLQGDLQIDGHHSGPDHANLIVPCTP